MKRTLAFLLTAVLLVCTAVMFVSCDGAQPPVDDTTTPTAAVTTTPTEVPATPTATPVPFPTGTDGSGENYDDIAASAEKSPSDDIAPHAALGWWDDWACFTCYDDIIEIVDMKGDTSGLIVAEEGRGLWLREQGRQTAVAINETSELFDIKTCAWLEAQGDSGNVIVGLHQNEDGTFVIDETYGTSKMYSAVWTWAATGMHKNPQINYIAWAGVHSFVNNEEWAKPYVIENYPEFSIPTYPDGTPAQGYLEGGDHTTPHLAKLYDACAAKDINGDVVRYDELANNSGGTGDGDGLLLLTDSYGNVYASDAFGVGKDASAPFWLEYAKNAIDYSVSVGADYIWFDNWCGWDNINRNPVKKAFGDWSEYKFRLFLAEHPEVGITDTENFSISAYLKEKAFELDPDIVPEELEIILQHSIWLDERWLDDPVWMAYLCFKSLENKAYNSTLYRYVKEAALKYNGDAESVAVCGNDFPFSTYSAYDGNTIDMIQSEYANYYSWPVGFNFVGPTPNGYSGAIFSLYCDMARSNQSSVWYYDETNSTELGLMYGYEALAYNCTITHGKGGSKKSAEELNKAVKTLKEYFGDRRLYAEIGVVHSSDSEHSYTAPNGYIENPNRTDLSYLGWAHAFDELNIPYRAIVEDRLAERIDLCSMLVLPQVRSIDEKVITDTIIPWLNKGNTLIITGEDAGEINSLNNLFMPYEKSVLVDLYETYSGAGKVIYYEKDPSVDYFTNHLKADMESLYDLFLNDLKALVDGAIEEGRMNRLLTVNNLPEHVITTLNYSPTNNIMFADIVNMQFSVDENKLTNIEAGGELIIRLPSQLWGKRLNVKLFSSLDGKLVDLYPDVSFTVDGEYVTVTLPELEYYQSVIIREFK